MNDTMTIDTQHMTPHIAEAIKKALTGEEIVLAENGKPYAKITQVVKVEQGEPKKKREIGLRPGSLKYMADDFDEPLEEFKDYMPD